jgi:hypothetical protein
MPRVVVRKGYRCLPGKRRELLTALQRLDAVATAAGWPRGRYLFVETRSPGEPDLEVEFTFDSYGEMEQLERRLREHLARAPREATAAGQDLLLEPSATRYLLLLDEPAARGVPAPPPQRAGSGAPAGEAPGPPAPPAPVAPPAAPPEPGLTLAQQRARQLAAARAVMESAEQSVGLPPERRASQRPPGQVGSGSHRPAPAPADASVEPPERRPAPAQEAPEPEDEDEDADPFGDSLDATA